MKRNSLPIKKEIEKMADAEQRKAARDFSKYWKGKGYEKGESQQYWTSLLRGVFGIDEPEK